ncbi:hypothetical protein DB345_04130 [Spartobacteria bacterium LR76]|nr:hypothetical protein DB345_04130 [Spartobacteria bacterium LR76]
MEPRPADPACTSILCGEDNTICPDWEKSFTCMVWNMVPGQGRQRVLASKMDEEEISFSP